MGTNAIQNNFASGELSPGLWSRIDRPFYKSALEICRNFIPLLTGGLFFRPATTYSTHSKLNRDVWSLPFRFNVDQSYSLEFTEYKLRIHKDGGVILETAKTITGLTAASPGVFTSNTHGFSTGDEVYLDTLVGPSILNKQFYLVVYIDANTFSLTDIDGTAISTAALTAYASGGTAARVYEIASPYTLAEAKTLKFCGTADLMYLTCRTREPRVLIRAGNTSWSINTYSRYASTKAITAITKASPGVITSTAHGLAGGERIFLSHIEGMVELNDQEYLVVYVGADTFSLTDLAGNAIATSAMTAYTSGGDIAIVRNAAKTITAATKANPGVLTISDHGLATYDKIYISSVGGMTELNGNFYWVKKIDANTFSLTDELGTNIDTSAFTTYTTGGSVFLIRGIFTKLGDFPGSCGLYGGRFWTGGTPNDPDVFWGSMGPDTETGSSQYDDFTIGTEDTDAIVFTLTNQTFSAHMIYWFSGSPNFLVIGTSGGVYKVNGGSDGAAITPMAISSNPVSSVGVADIMPLFIDNQTYYLEQGALTLRGFGYSLMEDNYKAFDKNVLADEITTGGIVQIAAAKGRPELIYAVRDDGVLLSCTILEQNDVAGWARHYIGGDGKVLSITTEPRTSGFDRVGLFIERTIDGHTRRYKEYISEDPQIPDISDYFTDETTKAADQAKYEKIVFELQKQFVRLDCASILDNTQTATLALSAVSGTAVLATASASIFAAGDVGKFIIAKFVSGEEAGIAQIVAFVSATQVTVLVRETFSSVSFAASGWYLASSSITGLGHLEGETLGVITDGAVHPDKTVVDGAITLDYPVRYAIVGEKYVGVGRTLDLEIPLAAGVSQSRLRNIEKLFLKLRNTLGGKYGTTSRKFYGLTEDMFRREGSSYYDRPPTLFSGLKQIKIRDTWENEKRIYFIQDKALPMTVQAILPSEDIGEAE